jgi:signal transduction histidine kinase
MSGLIEDLLSLSRLNRKALSRESVDLAAMARQIVDDLRLQTPEHPADLVIPDRLTAWGDPSLLLSVMQNLLGNAWKYSSKQPQTRIEVGSRREGRQTVYFVKDNGIGFPMDQADKIFAPFHRLQNKADYPGTGIGLANVQRIIHRHNGKVWAESQPNAGATFFFTLGDATSPVPMTEASLAMPSAEPA